MSEKEDETAWVIEFPMNANGALYYGKTTEGLGMTNEHMDAIRFARRQDAEAFIEALGGDRAYAVEHRWVRPTSLDVIQWLVEHAGEAERSKPLREIHVFLYELTHNDDCFAGKDVSLPRFPILKEIECFTTKAAPEGITNEAFQAIKKALE